MRIVVPFTTSEFFGASKTSLTPASKVLGELLLAFQRLLEVVGLDDFGEGPPFPFFAQKMARLQTSFRDAPASAALLRPPFFSDQPRVFFR